VDEAVVVSDILEIRRRGERKDGDVRGNESLDSDESVVELKEDFRVLSLGKLESESK